MEIAPAFITAAYALGRVEDLSSCQQNTDVVLSRLMSIAARFSMEFFAENIHIAAIDQPIKVFKRRKLMLKSNIKKAVITSTVQLQSSGGIYERFREGSKQSAPSVCTLFPATRESYLYQYSSSTA